MPSVPIPPPPELLVCDLAGTTIHGCGEVPSAFRTALQEAGVTVEAANLERRRGASKREVLGRLMAGSGDAGRVEARWVSAC